MLVGLANFIVACGGGLDHFLAQAQTQEVLDFLDRLEPVQNLEHRVGLGVKFGRGNSSNLAPRDSTRGLSAEERHKTPCFQLIFGERKIRHETDFITRLN